MKYRVVCEETEYEVEVIGGAEDGRFELRLEGERIPIELDGGTERIRRIALGDRQFEFGYGSDGAGGYHVVVDGIDYRVDVQDARFARFRATAETTESATGEVAVKAPIPGLVVGVEVAEGDEVEVGQRLLVLDAMKLENEILATEAGRIIEVAVSKGEAVEKDQVLLRLDR